MTHRLLLLPLALFILAATIPPARAENDPTLTALPPISVGRYTVSWNGPNGLALAVDNVPLIRKSTLVLVRPGWQGTHYLYQAVVRPAVSGWETTAEGQRRATALVETKDARVNYTFTVSADRGVTVDMAYRLQRDVPAFLEYAHHLSAPVLEGARVSDTHGASVVLPTIPAPATLSQEQRRILSPVSTLRFDTRLGPITLSTGGDAPRSVLFDARSDSQGWAAELPIFWLGIGSPEQPVRFGDGVRHAVLHLAVGPAASPRTGAGEIILHPAMTFYKDARSPLLAPIPLIIPRPKEMAVQAERQTFRLTRATRIVVRDGATAEDKRGASLLQEEVRTRFGLTVPLVAAKATKGDFSNAILIGEPDNAAGPLRQALVDLPPTRPEGYTVAVSPGTVLVAGRDRAGTLWGVQTLIQLLAADASGPLIRPALIHDWPTLALRGVHLFHGNQALPFQKKLIDRVLARFKMNALFLQAERTHWDADPLLRLPPFASSKADLQAEIAYAKARGMTVYPLVQGYGHLEWLLSDPRNRAFAENPATPYALNGSDPAALSYLTRIVDEADDTFAAPGFHIGLDEIDLEGHGPVPNPARDRPGAPPRRQADLFLTVARYWHDHLKARGKEMWMWADMALNAADVAPAWGTNKSAADAAEIRAGLPRDIVMVDWQYSPRPRYPSLQRLKESGFQKIVGATWFSPEGIQQYTRAIADIGGLGAIQTTWAGYESSEQTALGTPDNRRQFTAMVLAADYFWNGGEGPTPNALPYDPAEVFAHQWAESDSALTSVSPGYTLTLADAVNRPSSDLRGYGPQDSFAGLPLAEPIRLGDGIAYRLEKGAILLNGSLNPPGAYPSTLTLRLPVPAKEIDLILAASHNAEMGTKLGSLTVKRTDGSQESRDLVYGQNIAALTDTRPLPAASTIWRGQNAGGASLFLRRLAWVDAAGTAPVESITLDSSGGSSAPTLFAITALPPTIEAARNRK